MTSRDSTYFRKNLAPPIGEAEAHLAKVVLEWLGRSVSDHSTDYISELGIAVGTSVGLVRKRNEDRAVVVRYLPAPPHDPFVGLIVCDGMGGMKDGETCAKLAVSSFVASMLVHTSPITARAKHAIMRANHTVFSRYKGDGGSTLSVAILDRQGMMSWVHVGDSRIYLLFKEDKRDPLRAITRDDTLAASLRELKGMSRTEANQIPYAEGLAQYIGIGQGLQPQEEQILVGKRSFGVLITTDGIHESLGEHLTSIVTHAHNPRDAVQRLLLCARWVGGRDNASLVFCESLTGATPERTPTPSAFPRVEFWDAHGKLEIMVDSLIFEVAQNYPERRPKSPAELENEVDSDLLGPRGTSIDMRRSKNRKTSKDNKPTSAQKGRKAHKQPELNIQFVPGNGDKEAD